MGREPVPFFRGDRDVLKPETLTASPPIQIAASAGELLDKISILRIKCDQFTDAAKLANAKAELHQLQAVVDQQIAPSSELEDLCRQLQEVNQRLWEVEDEIRECESRKDFGPQFIELARAVYKTNDRRSSLKRSINLLLNSAILEEKGYQEY